QGVAGGAEAGGDHAVPLAGTGGDRGEAEARRRRAQGVAVPLLAARGGGAVAARPAAAAAGPAAVGNGGKGPGPGGRAGVGEASRPLRASRRCRRPWVNSSRTSARPSPSRSGRSSFTRPENRRRQRTCPVAGSARTTSHLPPLLTTRAARAVGAAWLMTSVR